MPPSTEQRPMDGSWIVNAHAWTEAVRSGQIESRRVATDSAIVELVTAYSPDSVLDVGCGEGWLSRALSQRRCRVVGIDGSAPLIERARELGGGDFRVLSYDDIVATPALLGGPYDAIVCNFSLLDEVITSLLTALRSVLPPDGLIFIQTVHPWNACGDEPYKSGWRTETFSAFGGDFHAPMPWYFRTVESWVATLREAGLRIVEMREPIHPDSGRPLSLLLACMIDSRSHTV